MGFNLSGLHPLTVKSGTMSGYSNWLDLSHSRTVQCWKRSWGLGMYIGEYMGVRWEWTLTGRLEDQLEDCSEEPEPLHQGRQSPQHPPAEHVSFLLNLIIRLPDSPHASPLNQKTQFMGLGHQTCHLVRGCNPARLEQSSV